MKTVRLPLGLLALVLGSLLTAGARAQDPQDESDFDREKKQAVIEALVEAIDEAYLYPDRAPEIARQLRERFESGAYEDAVSRFTFAARLTDDLRKWTHDLHFSVRHQSGGKNLLGMRSVPGMRMRTASAPQGDSPAGASGSPQAIRIGGPGGPSLDPDSPIFQALHEQFRRSNFSMPKLEVLPGNVGYFRLDMMPPLDVAKPTLDAAMVFLSNTDALVIDLRDTPGGVGGFIPYLMSYFFAEGGKLLYTRHFGAEDRSERYFTSDEVGGKRRPELPLFVLTSSSTGSAAENLAFTLKHHGRATLLGETTVGGGHSARMAPLGDGFSATIPAAEVIHPETGAGFDGVGVTPHVAVSSGEALREAHTLALTGLLESATSPEERQSLERDLAELRASGSDGGGSDPSTFEIYVGQYGERAIFLEDGKLKYRRSGGGALQLKLLGSDTFRLTVPRGINASLPDVRFERTEEGGIRGFSLLRDGKLEEYVKRDGE